MIPKQGFTLIELLVVMAIISILATIAITNYPKFICKGKETKARVEINIFTTALIEYEADQGALPPSKDDYSSSALIEALKGDPFTDPPKKNYYDFKAKRITADNEYLSPLKSPYYYRENASVHPKIPYMHNYDTFDLWTKDCKDNEKGINNWEE